MARIIGGIGTSHVPTIGLAFDRGKQDDPDWKPLFDGYAPVAKWLAERSAGRARVLLQRSRHHVPLRSLPDLRARRRRPVRDRRRRPRPAQGATDQEPRGARAASRASLVNDEFDISVFQDLAIDHGCNSPLTMLWPSQPDWPGALVPIAINVLQHPLPTALRCYKLGQAVRRAVASWPEDLKVVVVGTGGLSHQLNGMRAGFNNTEWDLRSWICRARSAGADRDDARGLRAARRHRGRGSDHVARDAWRARRQREEGAPELLPADDDRDGGGAVRGARRRRARGAGAEREPAARGVRSAPRHHPFDLERSGAALRLNRFLHGLIVPGNRALFRDDPEAAFAKAGLSDAERKLVRDRDWDGLIRYGASFFTLEKLARVSGVSNPEMVAAMRGETLEDFLKTRNVPGAR